MARALGVGGVFFRCEDPAAIRAWYGEHLGMAVDDWGMSFQPKDLPAKGFTQWSPFPADTKYFDPPARPFMINLIVDDLDGALAQVKAGGAQVMEEREEMEYGRFGWFVDPAGNKVELWEPPAE
jgi:predicted enzyme related to lactoylglutathione lyase